MTPRPVLTGPEQLAEAGLIPPERAAELAAVAARYAVAVTPALAGLIDPLDPDDPIARQFVPSLEELTIRPEEDADPIGDLAHSPVEGIVHRYPDRVLLKPTHVCATYCRFCFRREMVGPAGMGALTAAQTEAALAYVAARPQIWEVILTGGDPLVLSPRRLGALTAALARIEHVKVVRVHTRLPVARPEAVTAELVEAMRCGAKAVYVALHANHARELTGEARAACARIVDAGLPMLGQTVLLKGVNDDPAVLGDLMRAMVESRVKPYYLHHPDLAPGTGHMRLTIEEGQGLMRALRRSHSGLCQPAYVLDVPGGEGKVPVGPSYLEPTETGWRVETRKGGRVPYPPRKA